MKIPWPSNTAKIEKSCKFKIFEADRYESWFVFLDPPGLFPGLDFVAIWLIISEETTLLYSSLL
jgi:hypothetical protein